MPHPVGKTTEVATVAAAAPSQRRWGKVVKMNELFAKKYKDKSKISFTDMSLLA